MDLVFANGGAMHPPRVLMDLSEKMLLTIEALYDAAVEEKNWPNALTLAEQLLGGNATFLYAVDTVSGRLISARNHNVPQSCLDEYAEHYVFEDCRNGFILKNPTPEIQYDYMHISKQQMRRDPHYDWLARYDWNYYIGGRVYSNDPINVYYGVQRSKRAGHVDKADIDIYQTLYPHLHRSVKLAVTLSEARLGSLVNENIVASSPAGVVLLGKSKNILYMNPSAERVTHGDGGFLIAKAGGIRAVDARSNKTLQALVDSAIKGRTDKTTGGGDMTVAKPKSLRPYWITVTTISTINVVPFLVEEPYVIVSIFDPDRRNCLTARQLQSALRLSRREAELLQQLVQGNRLDEIAARMNIRVSTARSHLKSIFRKTETHHQAELVALVGGLQI